MEKGENIHRNYLCVLGLQLNVGNVCKMGVCVFSHFDWG